MPCIHLRELYELCEKHELRISSHDAIRVVCRQCEEQEVCPSSLTDGENVLRMPAQEDREGSEPEQLDRSEQAGPEKPPGENRPR